MPRTIPVGLLRWRLLSTRSTLCAVVCMKTVSSPGAKGLDGAERDSDGRPQRRNVSCASATPSRPGLRSGKRPAPGVLAWLPPIACDRYLATSNSGSRARPDVSNTDATANPIEREGASGVARRHEDGRRVAE